MLRHGCPDQVRRWLSSLGSSHQGEIAPKIFQAVGAAEKRHEIRGVHENNVACAPFVRRHPDEAVEFGVSGSGERVRSGEIDRLTRQEPH